MNQTTAKLLHGLIRHAKGMLTIFAEWVTESSGVKPTN